MSIYAGASNFGADSYFWRGGAQHAASESTKTVKLCMRLILHSKYHTTPAMDPT